MYKIDVLAKICKDILNREVSRENALVYAIHWIDNLKEDNSILIKDLSINSEKSIIEFVLSNQMLFKSHLHNEY